MIKYLWKYVEDLRGPMESTGYTKLLHLLQLYFPSKVFRCHWIFRGYLSSFCWLFSEDEAMMVEEFVVLNLKSRKICWHIFKTNSDADILLSFSVSLSSLLCCFGVAPILSFLFSWLLLFCSEEITKTLEIHREVTIIFSINSKNMTLMTLKKKTQQWRHKRVK